MVICDVCRGDVNVRSIPWGNKSHPMEPGGSEPSGRFDLCPRCVKTLQESGLHGLHMSMTPLGQ